MISENLSPNKLLTQMVLGQVRKWNKELASSHTPCSNIENAVYNEWQFQKFSDWQSDRKPVSSELHKIILIEVQKGYKLLLKKIKSAFPVKCLSRDYVLHNYKVSQNSFEWFQRRINIECDENENEREIRLCVRDGA